MAAGCISHIKFVLCTPQVPVTCCHRFCCHLSCLRLLSALNWMPQHNCCSPVPIQTCGLGLSLILQLDLPALKCWNKNNARVESGQMCRGFLSVFIISKGLEWHVWVTAGKEPYPHWERSWAFTPTALQQDGQTCRWHQRGGILKARQTSRENSTSWR